MIIEKIDVRSFGLLTDTTLEFSETVNVIEGQNEAGKSTIAAFIKYMLFGFESVEDDEVLSERRKRINWNTGIAQGSMVVRVRGKRYLISRCTVPGESVGGRPTYKEDSSIIDMESGATAFSHAKAKEALIIRNQLLPFSTEVKKRNQIKKYLKYERFNVNETPDLKYFKLYRIIDHHMI